MVGGVNKSIDSNPVADLRSSPLWPVTVLVEEEFLVTVGYTIALVLMALAILVLSSDLLAAEAVPATLPND